MPSTPRREAHARPASGTRPDDVWPGAARLVNTYLLATDLGCWGTRGAEDRRQSGLRGVKGYWVSGLWFWGPDHGKTRGHWGYWGWG